MFNILVVSIYAPTMSYSDEIEDESFLNIMELPSKRHHTMTNLFYLEISTLVLDVIINSLE